MRSGSIERQCCVVDGSTKVVQTKQYNYWEDCIDIWYQMRCPYDAGHLILFFHVSSSVTNGLTF